MFCRISPSFRVEKRFYEGEIRLIGDEIIRIGGQDPKLHSAIDRLAQSDGVCVSNLAKDLGSQFCEQLLRKLKEFGIIQWNEGPFLHCVRDGTQGYLDAVLEFPAYRGKISNSVVAIVGCGAIGGAIACQLAISGIGGLILIDFDRVDLRNLNRQLHFSLSDIGRLKTEALSDRLRGWNNELDLHIYNLRIETVSNLESIMKEPPTAIICAADTPPIKIETVISRYACQTNIIFATAGVGLNKGFWGPIIGVESKLDYEAWLKAHIGDDVPKDPPRQSFGPTNAIIAGAMSRDLLHHLTGEKVQSYGCRVELDFSSFQVKSYSIGHEEKLEFL